MVAILMRSRKSIANSYGDGEVSDKILRETDQMALQAPPLRKIPSYQGSFISRSVCALNTDRGSSDKDSHEAGNKEKNDIIIQRLLESYSMNNFVFLRTKRFTLKGKRVHFQLYRDDLPLLHSKLGSFRANRIFVGKGISSSLSGKGCKAFIYASNRIFAIRDVSDISRDIATVRYLPIKFGCRRNLFVTSFDVPCCDSFTMRSGGVELESNVETELNKYNFIKSIKNNVIYHMRSEKPLITIGKVDKNNLKVYAPTFISDYTIFVLCVSSFLTKNAPFE